MVISPGYSLQYGGSRENNHTKLWPMQPVNRRLFQVIHLLSGIRNILYCFQIAGICLLLCVCTLTCDGGYIRKRPSGCYYSRRQCEAKVGTTGIFLEYV